MTTLDTQPPRTEQLDTGPTPLRDALARVRARARSLLLTRAGAWVLAGTLGGLIALIAIDFVLRFPAPVRWVLLLGALLALGVLGGGALRRAWGFAPSLTSIALRLERLDPRARGRLASGLELAREPAPEDPAARSMLARAVEEARAAVDASAARRLTDPSGALRACGVASLAVHHAHALAIVRPGLTPTGLESVLTPGSGAEW
ncbi:MAG: hypothetical protein ACIARR_13070, partial [Phycisphaerales bacterium JB059]